MASSASQEILAISKPVIFVGHTGNIVNYHFRGYHMITLGKDNKYVCGVLVGRVPLNYIWTGVGGPLP